MARDRPFANRRLRRRRPAYRGNDSPWLRTWCGRWRWALTAPLFRRRVCAWPWRRFAVSGSVCPHWGASRATGSRPGTEDLEGRFRCVGRVGYRKTVRRRRQARTAADGWLASQPRL